MFVDLNPIKSELDEGLVHSLSAQINNYSRFNSVSDYINIQLDCSEYVLPTQ